MVSKLTVMISLIKVILLTAFEASINSQAPHALFFLPTKGRVWFWSKSCVLSFLLLGAMSETMSGPENWLQFYQPQNLSTSQMSDSTIVTTTVTSSSMLNSPIGSGNSSANTGHLSPEGRVSKPIRRRSRASRRTPTTLLNTDTTNFRAMVQQFTGGPSAPFASGAHHGAPPNFGFALGPSRQAHHHPAMMLPPTGHGFHLQPQQQLLYPHHHHHQQGQQQYMFSLGNNSSNSTHHGQDHALLQRLGSSRPSSNMGSIVSDGFVIEGVGVPSSSQVPPASTVRPSNESRGNSFLF